MIQLPSDIIKYVFSYLAINAPEVALTCKLFRNCIDDEQLYNARFPHIAIDKEKLMKYIGDPGDVVRLPRRVHADLENPSIKGNVTLTWIPAKINNQPLTLNLLMGNEQHDVPWIVHKLFSENIAHWALILTSKSQIFQNTLEKPFLVQKEILKKEMFTVPKLVDVLFSVRINFLMHKETPKNKQRYTRVEDFKEFSGINQMAIAYFLADIKIYFGFTGRYLGMAGARIST